MLASYVQPVIRTLAALIVGWVLSLPLAYPVLVALGQTHLSPAGKEKLVGGLVVLLSAIYYAAVHAAERHWPSLTLLLGSKVQPVNYARATSGTAVITNLENNPPVDYSKIADGAVGSADASKLSQPPAAPPVGIDYAYQEFNAASPDHVAEHAAQDEPQA